jgi:hypothetical protein
MHVLVLAISAVCQLGYARTYVVEVRKVAKLFVVCC